MLIRKMTEGKSFKMGKGDARNVFGPGNGSERLTFNYAKFEPGVAFTQHVHDESEDVILVSPGEFHGTVAGPNGLTCVSAQAPPDPKLYDGSRDKPA